MNNRFNELKDIKRLNKRIETMENTMEEMRDYINYLKDDNDIDKNELEYLREFISYYNLEKLYYHFKENAYEDCESELPFPRLIL